MSILRAGLRKCLPPFMIPDVFVPARKIPLTPSGRVNHNVLQQAASHLNLQKFVPTTPREAPLTRNEQHVHRLVVETLGLPSNDIGLQDDFFDLGGDVFKAMLLSTKARLSGLPITAADIHDHPSLRELAGLCVS
ncbi:AMP-dependent synthetase/ligase [Penicillium pulvis]|uniref:AMP-dependent synthetase/ligase n=1 Tax=Penicillium pulvis TaxID=1562058 RepID=UPI0025481C44|nr:AMP-dependent synthetase/ligase [Penicillium pulvis]KAJ5798483.1 AMP-dependent synthetase/ligase [Penicillium pulvis]